MPSRAESRLERGRAHRQACRERRLLGRVEDLEDLAPAVPRARIRGLDERDRARAEAVDEVAVLLLQAADVTHVAPLARSRGADIAPPRRSAEGGWSGSGLTAPSRYHRDMRARTLLALPLLLAACEEPARVDVEPSSLRFGVRGQTATVHALRASATASPCRRRPAAGRRRMRRSRPWRAPTTTRPSTPSDPAAPPSAARSAAPWRGAGLGPHGGARRREARRGGAPHRGRGAARRAAGGGVRRRRRPGARARGLHAVRGRGDPPRRRARQLWGWAPAPRPRSWRSRARAPRSPSRSWTGARRKEAEARDRQPDGRDRARGQAAGRRRRR